MTRAFTGAGRGPRRRVDVRLPLQARQTLAELLLKVHELLEDPRVGSAPVDPLEELTGLDASAFDTSSMSDGFPGESAGASGGDSAGESGGEQGPQRTPRAPFFAPDDPAVARLLPDAHRDDPALAEEFRRLTEHGLRRRKQAALVLAASALRRPEEPLRLTLEEGQALAKSFTDVRLVLAERLGLRTDEDAQVLHEAVVSMSLWAAQPQAGQIGEEIGERIGEQIGGSPGDSSWAPVVLLYDDLTALQEDLVRALMR